MYVFFVPSMDVGGGQFITPSPFHWPTAEVHPQHSFSEAETRPSSVGVKSLLAQGYQLILVDSLKKKRGVTEQR